MWRILSAKHRRPESSDSEQGRFITYSLFEVGVWSGAAEMQKLRRVN